MILTHAHWDHSQNTDLFPNAEIVIHADELEYSRNPRVGDLATARYFADTLLQQQVNAVSGETELEPGVSIIETPGHTRGHISVVVETETGPVCIGGDAMSDAGAIGRGTPAIIFWSEADARASIQKIVAAANTIYPGHDRPFRVESNGEHHVPRRLAHPGSQRGTALRQRSRHRQTRASRSPRHHCDAQRHRLPGRRTGTPGSLLNAHGFALAPVRYWANHGRRRCRRWFSTGI